MYKACIFDLDGTLANTLESIAYFGNIALMELGFSPIEAHDYRLMVGNGADKLMRRMLIKVSKNDDKAIELRKIYDELYEANPMHLVAAYSGIVELILHLKKSRIQMAVLSNKPDNVTHDIVHSLFGSDKFLHIQGQIDNIPKKPDPTAVNRIISKMKLPLADILYIGDSGVDMETGNNASLDTAGVLWGFRDEDELESHGAKFIVDNSTELKKLILG